MQFAFFLMSQALYPAHYLSKRLQQTPEAASSSYPGLHKPCRYAKDVSHASMSAELCPVIGNDLAEQPTQKKRGEDALLFHIEALTLGGQKGFFGERIQHDCS